MIAASRRVVLAALLAAFALGTALAAVRVAREVPAASSARLGIVGPFAAWLGASAQSVALGAWLAAWILALVTALALRRDTRLGHAAAQAAVRDVPSFAWLWRAGPWLVIVSAVVLVGATLRAHSAAWSLWDLDEPWAFPSSALIFDDSHDALVHPPLYRALALGWDALVGWSLRAPRWLVRLPSLVCGALTLASLGWLTLARPSPRALVALLLAAGAGSAIEVSALARPYGAATLAVVVVGVIVLDADGRRLTAIEGALCVVATALAAWLDLVAGLGAHLVLSSRVVGDLRVGRWRDAVAVGACAALPTLPLLSGAAVAWRTGIDPASSTVSGVLPDLRPYAGESFGARVWELLTSVSAPVPAAVFLALLCVLVLVAWRRRARAPAVLLVLLSAFVLALLPFIALRARHLAWLPLVACAVLAILPPPLPKRAP